MASYGPAVFPGTPVTTTYAGTYPGTGLIPGGSSYLGAAITPSNNLYPGSGTFAGQGTAPLLWALLSYDDAAVAVPSWTDVSTKARSFSVSRGRESELSDFDAGTASLTLDNRQGDFDPNYHSYVRPQNQIWLREQFSGLTNDIFKGYVDSWDQEWPAPGMSDALAVATATDEFKPLSFAKLPVMDPPRDSYADLVGSDSPTSYWRWSSTDLASTYVAEIRELPTFHWTWTGFEWDTVDVGGTMTGVPDWNPVTGFGIITGSAIVGDISGRGSGYLFLNPGSTDEIAATSLGVGDPGGGGSFTIETWIRKTGNPGSTLTFMAGPDSNVGSVRTWNLDFTSAGTVVFSIYDSSGTTRSVTSGSALSNNVWYHLVAKLDGANLIIFLNGVQNNNASSGTGSFRPTTTTGATAQIKCPTGITQLDFDETACYARTSLPANRILAHYVAGTQRGFASGQTPSLRANTVLDTVGSQAPRNLKAGTRTIQGVFMRGQNPLDELRKCARAEMPNGALFVAKDGTLTFLDANHRSSAPYSTTQATFGDEGSAGQLAYEDISTTGFSDAFLINSWNGSTINGDLQTATDQVSIDRYGERSQSLSDLPLRVDSDVWDIVTGLLSKYKDPIQQITSITLNTTDLDVLDAIFQRDIGDRVRVIRTLPGPSGWFDQTLYIQKVSVEADNSGAPWRVSLGVSRL